MARVHSDGLARCTWLNDDELYIRYHDEEWGRDITGDDAFFERLSLEGFQAGLSWLTILKRRDGFRSAFKNFEITKVANMTEKDVVRLLNDEGIIRHRGKIEAVINNAQKTLELDGSLEALIRSFTPRHDRSGMTLSPESTALSKHLRKLGFKFVGPTTMHAMMQAVGLVPDHESDCFLG